MACLFRAPTFTQAYNLFRGSFAGCIGQMLMSVVCGAGHSAARAVSAGTHVPGVAGSGVHGADTRSDAPAASSSSRVVAATLSEDPRAMASRETHERGDVDTAQYRLWQDVDVDGQASASGEPSARTAAASVGMREQHTQNGRWTEAVTAFAMATAVALCALLGIVFGDSSDSGLAGAAVALIVGAVCGAVIGLCYRWHDRSSPI
jgi:hypothetical protein